MAPETEPLDGKNRPEAGHFAQEASSLKPSVEGHVERLIDRESLHESAGKRTP